MADAFIILLVISAAFSGWIVMDSLKRGKLEWAYAILSFIFWWVCLPFYLAGRKLLPGETREGGYGWNACKYFMLTWSALLGFCLIAGMMAVSNRLDGREMNDAQSTGAVIGVGLGMGIYFCLWIGVIIPVGIIGLLLKKNTVVEKGDVTGSPLVQATSPTPSAPSSPASPPAPAAPSVPAPVQSVQFSVARQGATIGTFDGLTFRKMIASGEILATDHYWKQGMAGWDLVDNYRG